MTKSMAIDLEFRMRVRAPRAVVFERLLRIEHLARWFCGWSRIEPKVGGTFKFGGETCILLPEGAGWETRIEEGEVLRRFAFTWTIRNKATSVSYELEDAEDGTTTLWARHQGVPIRESTCGTIQDTWRMCLGNLKSISEGRGDSVRPDHTPPSSSELKLTALVEATPELVFGALTNSADVDRWSTGGVPTGGAQIEPRIGGRVRLGWDGGPNRIFDFQKDRRLGFEWPRSNGDIRLIMDLEEKASGTAVYLTCGKFHSDDRTGVLRERGRWSDLLVCLKNHVEGGDAGFRNGYDDQVHGEGS